MTMRANCGRWLMLLGITAILAIATPAEGQNIVSHMEVFDEFLAELRASGDADARRMAYRRHFKNQDPELYATFVGSLGEFSDEAFMRRTDMILANENEIRDFYDLAKWQVPAATKVAEAVYGTRFDHVPSIITLNLILSNAQVRIHEDQIVVLYGLDSSASFEPLIRPNEAPDLRTTVAHELFHAHHWESNPFMRNLARRFLPPNADAPLWANVWSEGLATCASRLVYPDATPALIFGIEGQWEGALPRISELADDLIDDLDAMDEGTTARWLFVDFPVRADGPPVRAGYTITAIVAHHIIAEYGLRGATALQGEGLRAAMIGALERIASGEDPVRWEDLCVSDPEIGRVEK